MGALVPVKSLLKWRLFRLRPVIVPMLSGFASCYILMGVPVTFAQTEDFDKTSLTLRTALHYDPSAQGPLQKLMEMYQGEGRMSELISLYSNHVSQYPQDDGARLVYAKVLSQINDRRAVEVFKAAVQDHPNHAALAWEHGVFLQSRHDPKAVEEMARALSLEPSASKQAYWLNEMMKVAAVQGREDLVLERVKKLLEGNALSSDQRLRWARQALQVKLAKTAELFLKDIPLSSLSTESQVEVTLLKAQLLANAGNTKEAAELLDELLARLAPDYWRRREIFMQRLDVTSEGDERESMVADARQKWNNSAPKTEASALILADLLDATHRRSEALSHLQDAVKALPHSLTLQDRLMMIWETQGVDQTALDWLDTQITQHDDRHDLKLKRARWLYLAGKSEEALTAFESLLIGLDAKQQMERSVEFSRWLRRRNQLSEAALLLELALKNHQQRWDLRRELAELYFVQKKPEQASALFEGNWVADISADARLEIAQFLMINQRWLEARRFLDPWLSANPNAFDGHLLMAKINDRLGNEDDMLVSLEKSRALCDTDTRYQAWLETMLEFAEAREVLEAWLANEEARLTGESGDTITRQMLLLEQAAAKEAELFARTLADRLAQSPSLPEDKRFQLEREKLDIMSLDQSNALDVEKGLKNLIEKDKVRAEDHKLKLAALYREMQRDDLAYPLLETLDAGKCSDVTQLRAAMNFCRDNGLVQQSLATAERLTSLEPAEKSHWIEWISLLAKDQQEERLRGVLREVAGKANDWQLQEDVLNSLRKHLVASYWRSMLLSLEETNKDWQAARRIASELQTQELAGDERLWTQWLIAWTSSMLDDKAAVTDALKKLSAAKEDTWLAFPDGLELSARLAAGYLQSCLEKSPGTLARQANKASSQALPPFVMKWGYALGDGQSITRIVVSPDDGLLYVLDDRFRIHAVNAVTGKLEWRVTTAKSEPVTIVMDQYRGRYPQEIVPPLEVATGGGKLVYLAGDELICMTAATGRILWRSAGDAIRAVDEGAPVPGLAVGRVAIDKNKVFWFSPASATVAALNLANGKLLWSQSISEPPLPSPSNRQMGGWYAPNVFDRLRSGLSVNDSGVLVHHRTAALLDVEKGVELWRSGTDKIPEFPVNLESENDGGSLSLWPSSSSVQQPARMVLFHGGYGVGMVQRSRGYARSGYGMSMNAGYYGNVSQQQFQRWSYANNLRSALQDYSQASQILLNGEEVWAIGSSGQIAVSVFGMPVRSVTQPGVIVGFVDSNRLVTYDGSSVYVLNADNTVGRIPFEVQAQTTTNDTSGFQPDHGVTATIDGPRLYTSSNNELALYDLRSGSKVWNAALPDELKSWVKSLPQTSTASYPQLSSMMINGSRSGPRPRAYLPQGVLAQDERGGGKLYGQRSVLLKGAWVFPVNDGAIACLAPADDKKGGDTGEKTKKEVVNE